MIEDDVGSCVQHVLDGLLAAGSGEVQYDDAAFRLVAVALVVDAEGFEAGCLTGSCEPGRTRHAFNDDPSPGDRRAGQRSAFRHARVTRRGGCPLDAGLEVRGWSATCLAAHASRIRGSTGDWAGRPRVGIRRAC